MTNYDNIEQFPGATRVEHEAAQWVTLCDRRTLTSEEVAAFEAWKAESPRHVEALENARAAWDAFDGLPALDVFSLPPEPIEYTSPALKRGVSRRGVAAAIAAGLALVVAGGVAWKLKPSHQPPQRQVFRTALGEQKTVTLSDGSSIVLNTESLVEVDYSGFVRAIRLVAGEAYFEVEHDANRPFIVHAGEDMVRAVGTAFAVYLKGESVEVTVAEGRVALMPENADGIGASIEAAPSAEVAAGERATLIKSSAPQVKQIAEPALARQLSWRTGLLSFAGEPLSVVIDEVSRYTDYEIEVVEPSINSIPIGGSFRVGEVDEFLLALEGAFNIKVEHVQGNHVRLSRAL